MVNMGKAGFVWWFGIIEDVNDPLQLGRVKVRVYHFYSLNSDTLPTTDLPWAHVIMPSTSASYQGKGWSPTFMRVDSTVFGFFVDGVEGQMPIVLGTYPGIPQPNAEFVDSNNLTIDGHDVSQLARGTNKLATTKDALLDPDMEPASSFTYKAQYPFNKVFESERGHVVEMDDTPGGERIHVYHNGGSYMEMSTGMRVDKTNGTQIDIASQARYIKSAGDIIILSDGATTIYSEGAITMSSKKQISLSAPLININATGAVSITGGATVSISSTGATTISGLLGLYLNPL